MSERLDIVRGNFRVETMTIRADFAKHFFAALVANPDARGSDKDYALAAVQQADILINTLNENR
jgi:hypothetical protein